MKMSEDPQMYPENNPMKILKTEIDCDWLSTTTVMDAREVYNPHNETCKACNNCQEVRHVQA